MKHPLMAGVLALAIVATPACAALRPYALPNPIAAAQTPEQTALALIESYAATLEEATDLIADPGVPLSVKRALGAAERAATPSVDLVRTAFVQVLKARADWQSVTASDRTGAERAASALAIAALRLDEAIRAARAPIAALSALITKETRP